MEDVVFAGNLPVGDVVDAKCRLLVQDLLHRSPLLFLPILGQNNLNINQLHPLLIESFSQYMQYVNKTDMQSF